MLIDRVRFTMFRIRGNTGHAAGFSQPRETAVAGMPIWETWPASLGAVVRVMLTSRSAMWMAWGPDLTFLCNDA